MFTHQGSSLVASLTLASISLIFRTTFFAWWLNIVSKLVETWQQKKKVRRGQTWLYMLLISYRVMFWMVLDRDSSLSIVVNGPWSRRKRMVVLLLLSQHVTDLSHYHIWIKNPVRSGTYLIWRLKNVDNRGWAYIFRSTISKSSSRGTITFETWSRFI